MSAVHIQPVFSVPMGFARFEHPDLLNPHLKSLFLRREAEGRRNVEPSMRVTHALFESRFDLFAWPDREILTLRDFCFTALYQLIAQLNRYTQEEIDKIKIASDSWFHITRKGGYFGFHNHPMASWSGVYCVDSGGIDPASTRHRPTIMVRSSSSTRTSWRGYFSMPATDESPILTTWAIRPSSWRPGSWYCSRPG